MFVEVSQKLLSNALQYVTNAVPARSIIPILSGIKLKVGPCGMTLTAGTIDMMLQYEIPYEKDHMSVHESGSMVIPARLFTEIIRNLPIGLVTLETKKGLNVVIRSGKAAYHLSGMDPEVYPQISNFEYSQMISLPNDQFRKIIKQVCFAISSSDSRPVLTGVSCQFDNENLRLVATDGIRLASRVINVGNKLIKNFSNVIIPGKHLSNYSKMLHDEQAATDISIGDNKITFKTNNLIMQSSLIEGTFPSLDKLTPDAFTTEITFDSIIFLRSIERASLLAEEHNIVKLHISSNNIIELSSRATGIGDVLEEVEFDELYGDQISVCFNIKYMIDIMRSVDCSKVKIRFSGKWNPIIVQPIDNQTSLYIMTPIRSH
ncbi:DNA polymerase III subunit beta [Paenibacillus germinis]|uniref:DNA polymerase III subunit beta n=1 Tax=Paenibacillus germinis TaxID=2654979 RepID=UPI00149295B9|nr:DNA polymerase III subunit beta [Paenibacillus germinis]